MNLMMNWRELRGPALRAYLALAREWGLTENERLLLLGCACVTELSNWQGGRAEAMGLDAVTRISLLLGIHSSLHSVFNDPDRANAWIRRPHVSGALVGSTALDRMLLAGLPEVRQVHSQLRSLVV